MQVIAFFAAWLLFNLLIVAALMPLPYWQPWPNRSTKRAPR